MLICFLVVNVLLRLYTFYADDSPKKPIDPEMNGHMNGHMSGHMNGHMNGSALTNGHTRIPDASDRQIRDAEEFELEGLMSDDEEPKGHHAI